MTSGTLAVARVPGALALFAGLTAGGLQEPTEAERPVHLRIDEPSIAACGGCHLETYRRWSESLHARAWTNANVRAATDGFRRESCRPCHSPLPVLPTGLDRPPEFREALPIDGVHCLSCHGRADGVAAARTIEGAPCRPIFDPRLTSAELCYPCHEPTHGAFAEYARSEARARGQRCQDCHMPSLSGGGHDHGPLGGQDADFVARAIEWSAALAADALRVTVRNRTGHRFPGEIPSRSFVIVVRAPGQDERTLVLRKPHRGEERAENRLEPDEERVLRFALLPLPEGAGIVRVSLWFVPLPLLPREEGFLLGEWSVQRE